MRLTNPSLRAILSKSKLFYHVFVHHVFVLDKIKHNHESDDVLKNDLILN